MGLQICAAGGIQTVVQKWRFVKSSCSARNPGVVQEVCTAMLA